MRNIHLIQTEKPSKIFYIAENFHLEKGQLIEPKSYHNVYITSDEEIKNRNCWVTNGVEIFKPSDLPEYSLEYANRYWEKIILTTDQDLIANGVQAIDDKFLEWFVKNPSCESVEVKKRYSDFTVDPFVGYEIIIPQEEPKQETLEEAAEKRYVEGVYVINGIDICDASRECFIEGAKWQAEKMYSEEEVKNLFSKYQYDLAQWVLRMEDDINGRPIPTEWFEQFKKK
jgi:hypothetical protein